MSKLEQIIWSVLGLVALAGMLGLGVFFGARLLELFP
jgi:hypothetical protein